jgi:hypothetical protein
MITGIDHVVLLAAALEPAIRGFEQAGFSVVRGGIHPAWGTENALISFADGFYLELLAPREPAAARHRLWLKANGEARKPGQYAGYALESSHLEADLRAAAAHGLDFHVPEPGMRRRPDGIEVRWASATSARPDFPFLIEDLTPRSARVPDATGPLNARSRLAAVTVAVADVAEACSAYAALLGQSTIPAGPDGRTLDTGRGRIIVTELERATGQNAEPGVVAVSLAEACGVPRALTDMTGGAVLHLVEDDQTSR